MGKTRILEMLLVFNLILSMTPSVFAASHNENRDIVETAIEASNFATLVAALQKAELVDSLKGEGPYTVFAPTDEAFSNLLIQLGVTVEQLLEREDLVNILTSHIVSGKVMSSDLVDGMEVETLNGTTVTVSLDPAQVNGSNIVTADIEASNGIVHVIDAVLLPSKQGNTPVEEPVTTPQEKTTTEQTGDIVETAISAGNFTMLGAALQEAQLVEALKGEGPYTVFAPSDDAFAKLLDGLGVTAEQLLAREDLADILTYHVIQGKVMSSDLVDGMEVETLNGQKVIISLNPVKVNDSNIVAADIETSNGVIHIIDAVLLPIGEQPPIPETGNSSLIGFIILGLTAGAGVLFFFRRKSSAKI